MANVIEARKKWIILLLKLLIYVNACMALDCELNGSKPDKIAYTINVDVRGIANFSKIQQAIDSIPSGNNKWIRIYISHGAYMEKVEIPKDKGCIFMEGQSPMKPVITWGDHMTTDTSPTFSSYADNIVLKSIGFKNAYVLVERGGGEIKQAVAARLMGDKYAVVDCMFIGLQDTLWDVMGRHYFKNCLIEGAIDFIWGLGQSIYEGCELNVTTFKDPKAYGYITAQGRDSYRDTSGFVFKGCSITGGKTLLGRAYRDYSRVIFYQCQIPNSVLSPGWDSWGKDVSKVTYVEAENKGAGAETSKRVPWIKKMSRDELDKFVSLSYIDHEGWIAKLPPRALV